MAKQEEAEKGGGDAVGRCDSFLLTPVLCSLVARQQHEQPRATYFPD